MSRDHKPYLPDEKDRIINDGGFINKTIENGKEKGPFRVFVKGKDYPGLAMSRSIGDTVASAIGVMPVPDVKEFCIDSFSKFIIIGSDGLWDYITNEKAVEIVSKYYKSGKSMTACEKLIEEACKNWNIVSFHKLMFLG